MEKQYEKVEIELRNMTEAHEKLKIENQSLKQKIELVDVLEIKRDQGDLNSKGQEECNNITHKLSKENYVKQIGGKCDFKNSSSKSVLESGWWL